jgi:hypothetical protein
MNLTQRVEDAKMKNRNWAEFQAKQTTFYETSVFAGPGRKRLLFSAFNMMQYDFKTHGFIKFNHKEHNENKKVIRIAHFSFVLFAFFAVKSNFYAQKKQALLPCLRGAEFNFHFY